MWPYVRNAGILLRRRRSVLIDGDIQTAALALGVGGVDDMTAQCWEYDEPSSLLSRGVSNSATHGNGVGGIDHMQSGVVAGVSQSFNTAAAQTGFVSCRGLFYMAMRARFPNDPASTSYACLGLLTATTVIPFGIGLEGSANGALLKMLRYDGNYVLQNAVSLGVARAQVQNWSTLELKGDGAFLYGRVRGLTDWVRGEAVTTLPNESAYARDIAADTGTSNMQAVIDKKVFLIRTADVP